MSLPRLSVRNALEKRKNMDIRRMGTQIAESKICTPCVPASSCITGFYSKLQGMSPWDVFSMLTTGRLPKSTYIVGTVLLILIMAGMCTQERFFCQFLCPMGAVFAIMPIIPGALFKRNRPNCASKCALCKKRCPAHLDIDGDTAHSGECICCHACTAVCPRKIFIQALLLIKLATANLLKKFD